MLFMRKVKWGAGGLGALVLLAGGLYLSGLDAAVENHRVPGVIEKIGPYNGTTSAGTMSGLAADVKLDDGRLAHVLVMKTTNPQVGERVEVTEHHHGSGRTTFSWK